MTRRLTHKPDLETSLITRLKEDLEGKSPRYRLPLLAELPSMDLTPSEENRFIRFLNTPEAIAFAHEVAVSVLLAEFTSNSEALSEQANALLILTASMSKESAKKLAPKYCETLQDTYRRCLSYIDYNDTRELRKRAQDEKNSGYLRSLNQRTSTIRRQTSENIAEILEFVNSYVRLAHSRNSEVIPAHISDQRGVPLDMLYVQPDLLVPRNNETTTLSLDEFMSNIYRDVILGDPGAGKSTLGQKIIYDLTSSQVKSIQTVPFLVTLRDFQSYKKWRRKSIAQYVTSVMSEEYQLDPPKGAIEYLLATGKAIVIFDGLDELLDTYKKREMRTAIENFSELYATSRVLVTSRRIGYPEAPLRTQIFRVSALEAFTNRQVIEYTAKWFELDQTLSKYESNMLTQRFIAESSSITDLRENPLMLSLLCNLYRGARSIPRDRADLYERCATMLFDRWDAQRGIIIQGPLRSDAREALQDIALWIFQNPNLADGLPHNRLVTRLTEFYFPDKYENRLRAEEVAEDLLALWRGRAWVLTDSGTAPSGEPLYGFTHQTFLEYFAAIELSRKNPGPQKLWTVLSGHIARAEWDIVAQVAIQSLNKSYHDGANIIAMELLQSAASARVDERLNLLNFASRYLDALALSAKRSREVTSACVELALEGQPAYPRMPNLGVYTNRIIYRDVDRRSELKLGPNDLLAPLVQALNAPDETGAYARDEFGLHLRRLVEVPDPSTQGKALILALNYGHVLQIAEHILNDADQFPQNRRAASKSLGINCSLIRRVVKAAGNTNFWVPLEAARRGCIGIARAVQYGGVDILYCTFNSFDHEALDRRGQPILALKLLQEIISASDVRELSAAAMESLTKIAAEFRNRPQTLGQPIDSSWMETSGLESAVVQGSFDQSEPGQYLYDGSLIHPLDAGNVPGNAPRLNDKVSPSNMLKWDSLFGAACLMAVVIEVEKWDVYDYSEDQLAELQLGLLQPMAPVFLCRLSEGLDYEIYELLRKLPLSVNDAELLERWARQRVNFTQQLAYSGSQDS
jgi:hypothetical protein